MEKIVEDTNTGDERAVELVVRSTEGEEVVALGGSVHPPESRDLSCGEMWLDTAKAVKLFFDPVSDCFGGVLGCLCCVAVVVANAEDDRSRRATRYDVVHADRIRRREHEEANCGYRIGFFVGDVVIDTASSLVGVGVGAPRAAYLSCTGNNARNNTVLGYPRDAIDEVDLFSSCRCD